MYVTNIMAHDGHELVMWRFSKPRWGSASSGYGTGADKALFAGGVANGPRGYFASGAPTMTILMRRPRRCFAARGIFP